eukprot:15337756-Ditylum_brightwellii.AAC.1
MISTIKSTNEQRLLADDDGFVAHSQRCRGIMFDHGAEDMLAVSSLNAPSTITTNSITNKRPESSTCLIQQASIKSFIQDNLCCIKCRHEEHHHL